jgi:hypothetical protein
MTIPGPQLTAADAMELTELLGLLIDWIDSDPGHLPASLRRFIGNHGYDYDATALRTDLARFQFLLGGDEHPYFGTTDPGA